MMMIMIVSLALSVEEYTYGTSIVEYENGTFHNWANSLSSLVNDRHYP